MKLELRRYKSYPRLSEETLAFTADLWVDGVKVGSVENEGKGGPHRYGFSREWEDRLEAYAKSLPPREPAADDPDWMKAMGAQDVDLETLINELCNAEDRKAWFARQTKKAVLFRLTGDPASDYRTVGFKPGQREQALAFVTKKYGADIVEVH